MRELVRTNDAVLISAIEALLKGADIPHMVLDQNMSVLEGSLGMLPRRIVVDDEHRQRRAPAAGGRRARPRAAARWRLSRTLTSPTTPCSAAGCGSRQPQRGHRVGHDAILLAAATAARARRPGGRTRRRRRRRGAGAGGARPGVDVTLVEIDPELAALAAENVAAQRPCRRACASSTLDVDRAGATLSPRAGIAPGLGRSRADESAVQRSGAAERLARSGAPRWRMRRRDDAARDWVGRAARLLHSARHADADLAGGRPCRCAGGARPRLRRHRGAAGSWPRRTRRRSASWCAPRKGSRAPLALLPGLMLNDEDGPADRGGRGGAARRRSRCRSRRLRPCRVAAAAACGAPDAPPSDRRHQRHRNSIFMIVAVSWRRQRVRPIPSFRQLAAVC